MPNRPDDPITRGELRDEWDRQSVAAGVSEVRFTEALENIRRELNQGLTTVGVQTGAVEKTLTERISGVEKSVVDKFNSLKLWGALALVGGQGAAAFITAWVRPGLTHSTVRAFFHLF